LNFLEAIFSEIDHEVAKIGSKKSALFFARDCFGAVFCRAKNKSGLKYGCGVDKKQSVTRWHSQLKGLGLKSLACGSYIKHEPVWPFKRTKPDPILQNIGWSFAVFHVFCAFCRPPARLFLKQFRLLWLF